ncbi:MmyB family transcriptional regulator [Actinoplanes philippinensis]|uniref:MmyB family transcriptional regulator n=1 Tax=Actinoplanes philippinensis TaxID=35752 RepID=UPI0033F6A246
MRFLIRPDATRGGVRAHATGTKRFPHHVAGDPTLAGESLDLRAEPDLKLTVYTAEPGSPPAEALGLLASWALRSADQAVR